MRFAPTVLIAGLVSSAAGTAFAQMEIEEAIRVARENGVVQFREVELDDGRWEVEGRDSEGRKLEIDIDASNGNVIKVERD